MAVLIIAGSVYGASQFVAEELETALIESGIACRYLEEPSLDDLRIATTLIAIVSTTGVGDVPENIEELYTYIRDTDLSGTSALVAALGDSSYVDSYCMGGQKFHGALREAGCKLLDAALCIDANESNEPELEVIPWVLARLQAQDDFIA